MAFHRELAEAGFEVIDVYAADLRRERNRKRMARIRSKSKEVRDAVATATATDLRNANVEDDALPSVSVIFYAVTPTSPEAGAVDDPTGRGGGVEAGGGDGEVTTLDPNHPARSDTVRESFATDMPTHYPMGSHAPSTTRITLTYTPSATGSLFPTSSICEKKVMTRLPAPTIASAPPPPHNNHPERKRVKRKCSQQNCENNVVQGGVCLTHGARRKCCSHPLCEKSVKHFG
jgi:hypothetical protein